MATSVNEAMTAYTSAKAILALGVRYGVITETVIKDHWDTRYFSLNAKEREALSTTPKGLSNRVLDAALKFAGATTITEMAAGSPLGKDAQPATRQPLVDTAEARKAALDHFGIIV